MWEELFSACIRGPARNGEPRDSYRMLILCSSELHLTNSTVHVHANVYNHDYRTIPSLWIQYCYFSDSLREESSLITLAE